MGAAEITSRTAWITGLLLVVQASVGFFRVRRNASSDSSFGSIRAWLLTSHAVIGLLLPLLAFNHAWLSMKATYGRRANAVSLWIATVALVLLIAQAIVGPSLLRPTGTQTKDSQRLHLVMAITLIAFAGVHVLLNV